MNQHDNNTSFRPHEMGVEVKPPYLLSEPSVHKAPLVLSSPHNGRYYPKHFIQSSRLNETELRTSEDYLIDELFQDAVQLGVPLLSATFPRAYVDLNREPYELDQRMFHDKLPAHANTRSARVVGGLGTIARVVSENREIYARNLSSAEALDRIEHVYHPWHICLRRLLARTHVKFGHVILLDCHSMPSGLTSPRKQKRTITQHADFILGDRYGTSCSTKITTEIEACLTQLGYQVVRNKPYAGGFITEHYGRPAKNLHAIQIEINRALYIDETTLIQKKQSNELKRDLVKLVDHLMKVSSDMIEPSLPLAAE